MTKRRAASPSAKSFPSASYTLKWGSYDKSGVITRPATAISVP